MPPERHRKHMIGFATDEVEHQRGSSRTGKYTNDNPPGRNACPEDNRATDENRQRGDFTNGAGQVANESVPPAPMRAHCIHAACSSLA